MARPRIVELPALRPGTHADQGGIDSADLTASSYVEVTVTDRFLNAAKADWKTTNVVKSSVTTMYIELAGIGGLISGWWLIQPCCDLIVTGCAVSTRPARRGQPG
jgi:hypothetical protein